MTSLILDTNSLIWSITDSDKLGVNAARDIVDPFNKVYVSDISIFECAIKVRTGALDMRVNFVDLDSFLASINFLRISFDGWCAKQYVDLPNLGWADPFDAALMAQAIAKNMILVTSDYKILNSSVPELKTMDAGK